MMSDQKISTLLKLVIIIIALVMASYAWMSNGSQLKMDGLLISTRAVQNLSFSLDGGITWDDETSLNIDENFKFNSEITGNGINLYIPSTRREDGSPVSFRNATINKDYLEFEIIFKSDNDARLFLSNESFVEPTAGNKEEDLIGSDVLRKSSMGDFSRDLIAGSVRIAFFEEGKEEANMVWAPNPSYELIKTPTDYEFDLNSTNKQIYTYLNPLDLTEKQVNNLIDNINSSYGSGSSYGEPYVLKLEGNNVENKVKVRIWVEGNDRETHTSLKGGVFRIYLDFLALTKNDNKNIPVVDKIGNTIDGYSEGMEYSIDNGVTWTSYKKENNPIISQNKEVLVRYEETRDAFASDFVTLN